MYKCIYIHLWGVYCTCEKNWTCVLLNLIPIQFNLHLITALTGTCRVKPASSIRWIIITLLQLPTSCPSSLVLMSGWELMTKCFVLVVSNLKIKLTRTYSMGSHCILGVKHTYYMQDQFLIKLHLHDTRSCMPTSSQQSISPFPWIYCILSFHV